MINFKMPKLPGMGSSSGGSMNALPKAPKIPKIPSFKVSNTASGNSGIPKIPSGGMPSTKISMPKMKVNMGGYNKNNKKLALRKILGGIKLK